MMKSASHKMQYRRKCMPAFCLLLFLTFFLIGCQESSEHPDATPTVPTGLSPANHSLLPATPTDKGIDFTLSEMKEIDFYTVNPETYETEAVSAVVKGGLSDKPEELMNLIADSLEDAGYVIEMNAVSLEGENVVVDFLSDGCPVSGLMKKEEKAILDAIAQSLLDNLAKQNGVVFRIMGEAYESENFSFGQEYVYMKNQHK